MGVAHPAFSEITDNNHAGVIWVISLLCLVYSILTFITRGFIKWNILGWDDCALTGAQIVAVGQYIALFVSLNHGLGKTSDMLTEESRAELSKIAFTAQLLLILALCLSKCSVILLIRRVFTQDLINFWLICNVLLVLSWVWAIVSMVLIGAGCSISNYIPPTANNGCTGFAARWDFVIALDAFIEFAMVALPVYFLWGLQMAFNLKSRVVLAFAFRLPVAALAIVFGRLFTTVHTHPNPGVAVSVAICWQQLELAYSLISATIPCLKSFLKTFDTNFGMAEGSTGQPGPYPYGSQISHRSHHSRTVTTSHTNSGTRSAYSTSVVDSHTPPGETIKMNPLKPGTSSTMKRNELFRKPEMVVGGPLRPERLKNSTTISAGEERRCESRNSMSSLAGSQDMIIRRDVHFEIQHDYLRRDNSFGGSVPNVFPSHREDPCTFKTIQTMAPSPPPNFIPARAIGRDDDLKLKFRYSTPALRGRGILPSRPSLGICELSISTPAPARWGHSTWERDGRELHIVTTHDGFQPSTPPATRTSPRLAKLRYRHTHEYGNPEI
ncbi:hypothetical protein GQ43DRAFT_471961 [Delitschia confertaspora ATCC 74209]|uniref:Rhodopsin domain-containing protein n=1 Tax=Delitschia confertaspora ATCC 74209 TaxID=1513339 RepID=A0A9P4JKY4_9PLEO|nr:hypothetical protein GQ43DRAFT_471961 [Delitschia confertaspora ATCC 74209]